MDHYEELGLPRSAPPEEIRQAYRRVARLIHPDHCADDEIRRLADLQMKRLNGILAVLTDSARRAAYDERLLAAPQSPVSTAPPAASRQWVWPLTAAIVLLALLWAVPRRKASPVIRPPAADPQTAAAPPPKATRARHVSRAPHRTSTPAFASLPVEPPLQAPVFEDVPLPDAMELPMPAPSPPPAATAMTAPSPEQAGLAGEWLYVPRTRGKDDGLYPPEYIELRVTEENGVVSGRYRARYRVADQAISPNVAFHFRGRAGADGGSLPWTGASGAHGELTLRRLSNGALEVTWVADQLGAELGLVSGTATLVRKLE
jgi:DnaJ domain